MKLPYAEADIRRALLEVEALMSRAFAAVDQSPEPGSALDQCGLRDGASIVLDYLCHNEAGIALEHLVSMVREPSLPISHEAFMLIDRAGRNMGMAPESWQDIRPTGMGG
jgi:hypothetical protein